MKLEILFVVVLLEFEGKGGLTFYKPACTEEWGEFFSRKPFIIKKIGSFADFYFIFSTFSDKEEYDLGVKYSELTSTKGEGQK